MNNRSQFEYVLFNREYKFKSNNYLITKNNEILNINLITNNHIKDLFESQINKQYEEIEIYDMIDTNDQKIYQNNLDYLKTYNSQSNFNNIKESYSINQDKNEITPKKSKIKFINQNADNKISKQSLNIQDEKNYIQNNQNNLNSDQNYYNISNIEYSDSENQPSNNNSNEKTIIKKELTMKPKRKLKTDTDPDFNIKNEIETKIVKKENKQYKDCLPTKVAEEVIANESKFSYLFVDWASAKIYGTRKHNSYSLFKSLKSDLERMINDKQLYFYQMTSISDHFRDKEEINLFLYFKSKTLGIRNYHFNAHYLISVERAYANFKKCNYYLRKYSMEMMNIVEKRELEKLLSKAEEVLDPEINMMSKDYIMGMDVFNMDISYEYYAFSNNEYFLEYIERRVQIIEFYERPVEEIILLDMNYMLDNKKLAIPIAWNLVVYEYYVKLGQNQKMITFHRIKNKAKLNKLLKIEGDNMEYFSLFRNLENIFKYYRDIIIHMDEKYKQEILNKIEMVEKMIEDQID